MPQKFLALILLFSLFTWKAQAQSLILPTSKTYQSGHALYESQRPIINFEKGIFTTVPVDYNNPKSETFEIYSWFASDFNPQLPTVIYLTGGPGQGSHWGQSALESKNYNLLFIDQRGIALSKPANINIYLNPQFYKSEWTAQDLEVLRKKLQIPKWSIYAISYGTIPATIYASLFPNSTTALVLEGTAFSAKHLATFEEKKKIIGEVIHAQSLKVQELIFGLQTEPAINSIWFFQWARDTLLMNEGVQAVVDQLKLLQDPNAYAAFIELLKIQYTPRANDLGNDLFGLNDIPFYMISCQELGLSLVTTNTDLNFEKKSLIEVRNSNYDQICQSLQAHSEKLYDANQFSVTVPVTYFQGENDPATEVSGAYLHFHQVAQTSKQMLVMKNGGHNPNLQQLAYDEPAQREILELALAGKQVTMDLVAEVNRSEKALQWNLINR